MKHQIDETPNMAVSQTPRRKNILGLAVSMGVSLCAQCFALETQAGGIPFAGNRPESFEFPIDWTESYDSFGQFLQWNNDRRSFNANGNRVSGPGTHTFVGLSSRLHYFKFDSMPNVGWLASLT